MNSVLVRAAVMAAFTVVVAQAETVYVLEFDQLDETRWVSGYDADSASEGARVDGPDGEYIDALTGDRVQYDLLRVVTNSESAAAAMEADFDGAAAVAARAVAKAGSAPTPFVVVAELNGQGEATGTNYQISVVNGEVSAIQYSASPPLAWQERKALIVAQQGVRRNARREAKVKGQKAKRDLANANNVPRMRAAMLVMQQQIEELYKLVGVE